MRRAWSRRVWRHRWLGRPVRRGWLAAFAPAPCLRVPLALKPTSQGLRALWVSAMLHPDAGWYDAERPRHRLGIGVLMMAETCAPAFLWETFARNPEVGIALKRAGFTKSPDAASAGLTHRRDHAQAQHPAMPLWPSVLAPWPALAASPQGCLQPGLGQVGQTSCASCPSTRLPVAPTEALLAKSDQASAASGLRGRTGTAETAA